MNENMIGLISAELQKAEMLNNGFPESVGMFLNRTANQTIQEAATRPNPKELWLSLWYEGEVCCLFADSNVGKSIYAVQIAAEIAKSQIVLYFDFELSDKQFQLRYTDEYGSLYQFPNSLYRVEFNRDALNVENFEDAIIKDIEAEAIQTKSKVLIIDNLTYLCSASEKGDSAGVLMMKLMALKRKHNLSILILAHTPKRNLSEPITQNHLAGSKKLYNFFDSVFTIGKSAKDGNLRYVKQLKVRYGNYTYDSDNVIVCTIEKVGSFLQFVHIGYAEESEHLKQQSEAEKDCVNSKIIDLISQGKSYKEISELTGLSKATISRIKNKSKGVSSVSGVSGVSPETMKQCETKKGGEDGFPF